LILAALASIIFAVPLAILFGLLGVVLSLVGLIKIKKNPEKYAGKGFAWFGIILGLGLATFVIGYLLAFAGV
jgi:hypothetical protein